MNTNTKLNRWLSSRAAAQYSGLGFSTLAKLRVQGGPPYVKVGSKVLYSTTDLDAWLESKRLKSTSQYTA